MRLLLPLFLLFSALFAYSDDGQKLSAPAKFKLPRGVTSKDYIPNQVIVKFKAASAMNKSKSLTAGSQPLKISAASVTGLKPLFSQPSRASVRTFREEEAGLSRIYELTYAGQSSIENVINELLGNDAIEYAEPRYIHRLSYSSNDALFNSQNYLRQIRAPQAWDFVRNASGVVIAIVDTGSDLEHEDLAANIHINPNDPVNGIDDDGDGYVDNFRGWDLVGRSANNIIEDNDPDVKSDSTDHGVHVSGIASAVTDNGIGVSSVAFNARLLIVKAGADEDAISIYRGYEGIKYAADHGAQIINCSWGSFGGGAFGRDIVNYALSKGCLIVAAAGNDNTDQAVYPASYSGVLGVANVRSDDTKSFSSNYGDYVDVSAPGSGILNTTNNNTYRAYSGTSMAAPMVASTAALVKARFPDLSMQQVGEQIRVTADVIDNENPGYEGQLGRGRVNVYRAVTEILPSVRNQKLTVIDKGGGSLPAGDTLQIFLDLKNFLAPASGLTISITASHPQVRVLTPSHNVGALGMLETKAMSGPFRVFVENGMPDNTPVNFRIHYSANGGAYTDFESFSLVMSLDYINVDVNQVATTLTSNGRVGYSSFSATNGQGFIYKSENLLYEAALMIGNSATRLSNNARRRNGMADEHFRKQLRVQTVPNSDATFEGRSEFDDSGNANPLNLYVRHRQVAYDTAPDDKYVIAEYEVINRNATTLEGVYIGLFTDWDIDVSSDNITKYDAANRMAYAFSKYGKKPYGAVKILNNTGDPLYYPLTYMVAGSLLEDGFSLAEKYTALSSGIASTGLGENAPNGYDVMFVIGSGPYNIPANGSVRVAFAFIGGDDLNDIAASAVAAQQRYQLLAPSEPVSASLELRQNYPNPVTAGSTTIEFSIPEAGNVNLTLYNILGQSVRTLVDSSLEAGVYRITPPLHDLQSGLYFYKIIYNDQKKTLKLNLQH